MKNPYGMSDFGAIRREGYFYVDKTHFLPVLESAEMGYAYLIFLRPRRFGKSTLLSMLGYYYDIDKAGEFEELFKGLWIHEHPTKERNRYLILSFDFSKMSSGSNRGSLQDAFSEAVRESLRAFCTKYASRIPQLSRMYEELKNYREAAAMMSNVLGIITGARAKVYLLIDEYDSFANTLLSAGSQGLHEESIVRGMGSIRGFYATLKSGTGTGAISRIFITGVTPLLLDDISSGFNIASNISRDPGVSMLAGFSREDAERAVNELLSTSPSLSVIPELSNSSTLLDVLEKHYNGYLFSEDATERVFNSGMVLYFLGEVAKTGHYPAEMLDPNVSTEYRHLQPIGTFGAVDAAKRLALLESILMDGGIRSDLVSQFGEQRLKSSAPFISLLYYLGMLTLKAEPRDAIGFHLEIPNRVIRELQWEHLALMLSEQTPIDIDVGELRKALEAMAAAGDIEPFLSLFHAQVIQAFGVKDTRNLDEKTIKLLFMTYVSLGRAFHPLSEKEFAQGYCDLFLGASLNITNARFSWLLEFKYLPTTAKPAHVEAAFAEAEQQVERYASDKELLPILLHDRQLKAGMLVFVGTKRVLFRPWPAEEGKALTVGTEKPSRKPARAAAPRKRPSATLPRKKASAPARRKRSTR